MYLCARDAPATDFHVFIVSLGVTVFLKRSLWTQGYQTQNIRTQLETWPIGSTGLVIYLHGWFIFSGIEVNIYKSHWSHGSESNAVTKNSELSLSPLTSAQGVLSFELWNREDPVPGEKKQQKTPDFFVFFSMVFFGESRFFLLKQFGNPIEQGIWKNRRLSCSNP